MHYLCLYNTLLLDWRGCYCSSIKYKKIKGVFSPLPLVMGFNIVSLFSKEIIKLSFERKHRRETIFII